MIVTGKEHLVAFKKRHSSSAKALDRTLTLLETNQFKSPVDLKRVFGVNVDFVGSKTVIDSGGNKTRVILVISFQNNVGVIEAVLTHSDYDKGKWKDK